MKRPDIHKVKLWLLLGSMLSFSVLAEVPEDLAENWYRTEILIFVREDPESALAEQWEPLPNLTYPESYRFLLDPSTADRRLEESLGYESTIDARGRQTLQVPSPIEEVLDHSRPDAITVPLPELDTLLPADQGDLATASNTDNRTTADAANTRDLANLDPNEPLADLESPILSLPYELLKTESLEFRAQARSLRRRGERVVFHGSWWAMLDDQDVTPALIMDRSGDMDSTDWPQLQGSLKVYRSRYLHVVLDLWLNTLGEYLPTGWQIDAPPVAPSSLIARTLSGQEMDPWTPAEVATPDDSEAEVILEDDVTGPDYPWRHAIVHRQTRRMRSGEIHYLDHPVIGVIVKVTPMSEEALPLRDPAVREFRERHALPIAILPMDSTETPESN